MIEQNWIEWRKLDSEFNEIDTGKRQDTVFINIAINVSLQMKTTTMMLHLPAASNIWMPRRIDRDLSTKESKNFKENQKSHSKIDFVEVSLVFSFRNSQ